MTKKFLLLLMAVSTLLAGCASTFTTLAKRPDGTSLVLVASESEIMDVTYDAITSQFPSDNITKLPPSPDQQPQSPVTGYRWSHWFGLDPGSFTMEFQRVAGDAKDKTRVIGWAFTVDASSTRVGAAEQAIPPFVSALQYAYEHRNIPAVQARNVRPATEAEAKAAASVFVEKGSGTGFFVSKDGYLITNHHVIADATRIDVHAANGNIYRAKLITSDPSNDVALLKVEAQATPLNVTQTATLQKGAEVFTLGYPLPSIEGNEVKATFGRINALSGLQGDIRYVQMDVPIQPGNSGGPLIGNDGAVVGIVSATVNQKYVAERTGNLAQNVNYAVKSEYFLPLLKFANIDPPQTKAVHEAIKNPSQFEPSVVHIVAKNGGSQEEKTP